VDHYLRRTALAARAEELAVDAVLVTNLPNVRYLTGFTGTHGELVLGPEGSTFLTDGRYLEQARHQLDPEVERVLAADGIDGRLAATIDGLGVARLGFEAHDVSVARHARLVAALEGVELVPLDAAVGRQRIAKDPDELEAIRRAQQVTDQAFEDILDVIEGGISERQLATVLEQALRRDGGEDVAFPSIVAFGEHAAEPHHRPGHRILEEGDVIKLDFGAVRDGYHSDMTRTVAFGSPAAELRKMHDVVREAQQAGIDAVRAGVTAGEVDAAARGVIDRAGYGEAFSHGLGHGVGLETHEAPWLRSTATEPLPAGAVVTIEPGVYVPGLGGVRVEDMVEVTDDGCRVVGTSSRELIEL
jgi:Xaa-Pro aminopeptidase